VDGFSSIGQHILVPTSAPTVVLSIALNDIAKRAENPKSAI